MKRLLLATALVLSGTLPWSSAAFASHRDGPCSSVHWAKRGRRGVVEVVRCVARRVGVPGGPRKMIRVGNCESGLDPRAIGSGLYLGVYQQHRGYWPGRAEAYGFRGTSALNARANAWVSAKMAKADGTWLQGWPVCGAA